MRYIIRRFTAVWMIFAWVAASVPAGVSAGQMGDKTDIDAALVRQDERGFEAVPKYRTFDEGYYAVGNASLTEGVCGESGENVKWEFSNGSLNITGSGAMADFPNQAPWGDFSSDITSVCISGNITNIGEAAFYRCSNLNQAELPVSLAVIGKGAFAGCSRLKTIKIPENVAEIGDFAFQNAGLESLVLPEAVKSLGMYAASYCSNLKTAEISSGVKEIKEGTFYYSESLKEVTLKKGLLYIRKGAFYVCSSLTSLRLPSGIKKIDETSFSSCTKVKNLPEEYSQLENGLVIKAAKVKVSVKEQAKEAFSVLKILNQERKKQGLKALKMDKELLKAAMTRTAELSLYYSHTRPGGASCFSASDLMYGENIAAGYSSAASVMTGWMNSPGHRANILSKGYKSVGIGCVEVNGIKYWAQCFGRTVSSAAKAGAYKNRSRSRNIVVSTKKPYYVPKISVSSSSISVGGISQVKVTWHNNFVSVSLPADGLKYKTTKKSVCTVSKGKIKGKSKGTAKIKIWFPGYKKGTLTRKITVR